MTHLPFIAASYALGVLVPLLFGIAAFTRMGTARRRLAAIDPRDKRPGTGSRVNRSGAGSRDNRPGADSRANRAGPHARHAHRNAGGGA